MATRARDINFNVTSGQGGNPVVIYSPEQGWFGNLLSLRLICFLNSIDTVSNEEIDRLYRIMPPDKNTCSSVSDVNQACDPEFIAGAQIPRKRIDLFLGTASQTGQRIASIWAFNRKNRWNQIDLKPYLSTDQWMQDENHWLRLQMVDIGYGLLQGSDYITVFGSVAEQTIGLGTIPHIFNILVAEADKEYSVPLPFGTSRYSFKCRGDGDDPVADIRFAWNTGQVAERKSPYQTLSQIAEQHEDEVYLTNAVLYFAADTPVVIEVSAWT